MLACQRGEFSLPHDVHFLNCAYMGPLPLRAQEAGIAGIRRKAVPTGIATDDFFRDSDTARALFAAIIGAPDRTRIAIIPSVSYGVAAAARNLPCAAGQRVVLAAGQFPSNVYAWRRFAAEHRGTVHTVHAPAGAQRGPAWTDAIVAAIDDTTAVVALPHVHWTDGTRFDLERIGAKAREHGAAVIIDGTQSIGAMAFDLDGIRPDAVFCAGYKWLLGPYGIGFGWFGPRFDNGVPLEETWLGRQGSHDFQRLADYRDAAALSAVLAETVRAG